jgi:hypothetical protein
VALTVVAIALAMVASACGSSSSLPAVEDLPDLEFGQGEMPISVPVEFPVPEGTAIGSTMIDGTRVRTEVVMIFPANSVDVVAFYETELPDAGFEITDTREDSRSTFIDFSGNGVDATVTIRAAGPGLSEGFLVSEYS